MSDADVRWSYLAAAPKSHALYQEGEDLFSGAVKGTYCYSPFPLGMERGEGAHVWDLDGTRFLDFVNHFSAQILGHRHPAILAAVDRQLQKGIVLGGPTGVELHLARELSRRVPSVRSLRFCNSGTEATLHAIRLARGFTGKAKVAKFEGAHHGSHDSVDISVGPSLDEAGPAEAPRAVATAGGINPRTVEQTVILPYNNLPAVQKILEATADELACVIVEPRAGIFDVPEEFWVGFQAIVDQLRVPLILDESVSYRLHPGGFQKLVGLCPDLTTFAKIIGGGFPVGAFGGRAEIMRLLHPRHRGRFFHDGTFSGHPITMAAGVAALQALDEPAYEHLSILGRRLAEGLARFRASSPIPFGAVVNGSLFSIHFSPEPVQDYRALARTDKSLAHRVFIELVRREMFLTPILIMNSLSVPMSATDIDRFLYAFEEAVLAVAESTY